MMGFRKAVAATAFAAAAVMAGAGTASASDYSPYGEHDVMVRHVLSAQCNDASTQFGKVNYNQGPVCIDFGSEDGRGQEMGRGTESDQDTMNAACNSAVTQFGKVNYNQGPVCIRF
ncbi:MULTISPECIES: hypothetical protein [Streptomyces]|uniref:hypothetical protein n=1 Tax=Streptomyces TaxID=1883 RepID=UPI001E5B716C|nr:MULTISPECIES: hypothetical protein [Streptomyces]MCZ4103515.1 hypothetical protein [Streptomyces sp. H39-C1]